MLETMIGQLQTEIFKMQQARFARYPESERKRQIEISLERLRNQGRFMTSRPGGLLFPARSAAYRYVEQSLLKLAHNM